MDDGSDYFDLVCQLFVLIVTVYHDDHCFFKLLLLLMMMMMMAVVRLDFCLLPKQRHPLAPLEVDHQRHRGAVQRFEGAGDFPGQRPEDVGHLTW